MNRQKPKLKYKMCKEDCSGEDKIKGCFKVSPNNPNDMYWCCECHGCPTGSEPLPEGYENCVAYCQANKLLGGSYSSNYPKCCQCSGVVAKPSKFVLPTFQIIIPGLKFTEDILFEEGGRQYYKFPWIGEYLVALFKWGTTALAILAVIMIMVAGFKWMTAMGNPSKIGQAKSKISDALFGLILILGANLLLGFINPSLTIFKPIVIEKVERIELNDWTEDASVTNSTCPDQTTFQNISNIDNVVFVSQYSQPFLLPTTAEKLTLVAAALKNENVVLQVNNAFRTREQQKFLYDNRGKNPGCMPTKDNQCNCPHMLGAGVDVVCKSKSVSDPCQAKVKKAMLDAGFCQLSKEAWHFEYPKMSGSCVK